MTVTGEESMFDRARIYRKILLEWENLDAAVCFVSPYTRSLGSREVKGKATWKNHGGYQIRLANNLSIGEEVRTLAHEVAHVLLGHVLTREFTPSEFQAATQEVRTGSVAMDTREAQADTLGAQLVAKWRKAGLI